MKIAFLSSTSGSDLPAAFEHGKMLGIEMILVTNREDCGAREKASLFSIPEFCIVSKGKSREEYDAEIIALLQKEAVDFVFLVGYMRIVSSLLVDQFQNRMYNIHPSLLPAFAGGMDADVHSAVLQKGCRITGATLHLVTEGVDEGPIIAQKACEIGEDETPQSLKLKVQKLEQEMITEEMSNLSRMESY